MLVLCWNVQLILFVLVNSMKQASAFPPNFIHSLDATHMMLTALECRVRTSYLYFFRLLTLGDQTQNITYASVHDSYWTHACSIDQMSEIIRDTFIALHSSDVLGKLQFEVSLISPHLSVCTCAVAHLSPFLIVPTAVCGI